MMMRTPSRAEIRKRRQELGLTQRQVAERAGISQPLVARIETGSVDPRVSTLGKILDVLNHAARDPGLTAGDIMSRQVHSVRPSDTVRRAASLMNRGGYSLLPVLDYGRVVGSITERRLVEEMAGAEDLKGLGRRPVEPFVQPAPPQVSVETDLEHLWRLLDDHPMVIVTGRGRSLGVVTKADLLGAFSGDAMKRARK